jgi:TonB family protein
MRTLGRITLLVAIAGSYASFAQTDSHPFPSRNGLGIVSLSSPAYPPVARLANISGEVELKLGLRKDGTIESLIVVSGHPMLAQAALSSAHLSRFDCGRCEDEVTSYTLTYSFQFLGSDGWRSS